jgi:hypothetical protein
LLLLHAGHYLALPEFRKVLLIHKVFCTGRLLLGTVRPRGDKC